jgi:Holin of 3TMs, for gene-transfer release
MIKRLDPTADADSAKPPKQVDGLQFDASGDDDTFFQGTGQSIPSTVPTASIGAVANSAVNTAAPISSMVANTAVGLTSMSTSTPVNTATSVTTSPGGATTITMTPSSQYAPAPQLPMSSTGADLSAISDINSDIVARKMALEEAKFQLDSERAKHAMYMEIRKEDFRESQLREEEEKNAKKEGEHWMKAYWRPAMGWLYMLICAFDFVIAPMLTMAMPIYLKMLGAAQISYTQWQSLTLANGGLIHLSFGAILGVTAWTRGQEKIAKMG